MVRFRRAARVFWIIEMALALTAIAFAIGGRSAGYSGWGFRGFPALITVPFATMGMVILSPAGWGGERESRAPPQDERS
jgi:hypothetical protein